MVSKAQYELHQFFVLIVKKGQETGGRVKTISYLVQQKTFNIFTYILSLNFNYRLDFDEEFKSEMHFSLKNVLKISMAID